MKISPPYWCLFLCALPLSAADTEPPKLDEVLDEAIRIEAASSETFREIRAIDAAILMRVPVEEMIKKIEIAKPLRSPGKMEALGKKATTREEAEQQKDLIREASGELTNVLQNMEEMLAEFQLQEAEQELNFEQTLEETKVHEELNALAEENSEYQAVDLTALMDSPPPGEIDEAAMTEHEARQLLAQLEQKQAELLGKTTEPSPAKIDEQATESVKVSPPPSETESTAKTEAATKTETSNAEPESAETTIAAAKELAAKSAEAAEEAQDEANNDQAQAVALGNAKLLLEKAKELAEPLLAGEDGKSSESGKSHSGRYNSPPGTIRSNPIYEVPSLPGRRIEARGEQAGWMYIDSWYVIGPFPNPARRNIEKRFPPESIIDLDASYPGRPNEMVSWRFLQTDKPWVKPPWEDKEMIYYAYTQVWSDRTRDLWIALGSDDNSRVWLNDQLIWKSSYRLKPWRPDEGYRKVTFRKGTNRILYRVENGSYITRFSFLICANSQGRPILPVKSFKRSSVGGRSPTIMHQ